MGIGDKPRLDPAGLEDRAELPSGHDARWREREISFARDAQFRPNLQPDPQAGDERIMLGRLERGVVTSQRNDEIALMRPREPYAEGEASSELAGLGEDK